MKSGRRSRTQRQNRAGSSLPFTYQPPSGDTCATREAADRMAVLRMTESDPVSVLIAQVNLLDLPSSSHHATQVSIFMGADTISHGYH